VKALIASVSLILVVTCGTLGLVASLPNRGSDLAPPSTDLEADSVAMVAVATVGPSPTPRHVTVPAAIERLTELSPASASAPLYARSVPLPAVAIVRDLMVTATATRGARADCDPAYPDERTCIPPGPPFDQGCAITDQRNFTVLPPDPQHLDADGDGIGCEPITSSS
jgi:hypothetical protein